MNIDFKPELRPCTGCQMCAAVCPKEAITIVLDKDGFYKPYIDYSVCINCGICTKYCYKYDKAIPDFDIQKIKETTLYAACAKNKNTLKKTTSGGVADILSHVLYNSGYKCIGVIYNSKGDNAVNIVAQSNDDLNLFRGSKYIQSYTVDAFKQLVSDCKNERFAVFGTPCHIYTIHKFLEHKNIRNQHILVDLYCHGCPTMNLWKKYIDKIHREITVPDHLYNVNFRSKKCGWGHFIIEFSNKERAFYIGNKKKDAFFDLFFSDMVLNEACNDCKLRSTLLYSDIRLGDFWGKEYIFNNKGMSAVSLNSPNAKKIFESIKNQLCVENKDYDDFVGWQHVGKQIVPNQLRRQRLLSLLSNKDMPIEICLCEYYRLLPKFVRAKKAMKGLILLLPNKLISTVKYICYKL